MPQDKLTIKKFMDGAELEHMRGFYQAKTVSGFTTNPSLVRKAGISDYEGFARSVLADIPDMPISFEVFSDDFATMEKEARKIATWGKNVNVKIPISNTKGESAIPLIRTLSHEGFSLNVTALMTEKQVESVAAALNPKSYTIVSVFAGRIADTGRDPMPVMRNCASILKGNPNADLLWASTRELFNIVQAQESGCHIITVTPDVLKKLDLFGKDLVEYSLETVKMFYKDATAAGFKIV